MLRLVLADSGDLPWTAGHGRRGRHLQIGYEENAAVRHDIVIEHTLGDDADATGNGTITPAR
jgi:hypothetical protein